MQIGRRAWKITYVVILVVLTGLVVGSFVRRGINFSPVAMFPEMVDGTAHRPFVQRAVVPFLVRNLAAGVPDAVREAIDESIRNPMLKVKLVASMRLLQVDWTQLLVAASIWFASIVGFALSLKGLARSVYRVEVRDDRLLDVLSLAAVAGLPVFFRYYSYLYDLTHLFLFTACLIPLLRARMAIYLPLFLLTALSKETAVLLIGIFALQHWKRLPQGEYLTALAVQAALFVGSQWFLRSHFSANPGGAVEWHLFDHNLWLWPFELSTFVAFGAIGIAIARGWSGKPRFLRLGFATTLPVLVGLTLALGYLDEYRDYYEVYAFTLLLMAPTLVEALGRPPWVAREP